MNTTAIQKLKELYGENDKSIRLFHSPGRVNLIGEHTDYNGGYVFPCALDFGTFAAVRLREDGKLFFASTNFDLTVEAEVSNIAYQKEHDWANYPKGVLKVLQEAGYAIPGFEVVFEGNIPNGAGLSSSASIELAMAVAVNEIQQLGIPMVELVKIAQKAENVFNGVNCGIMDQFAVGMGRENQAIFLKCDDTLEYSYVPLAMDGYKLVISNTNKRRTLADSKYNERRSQCEEALQYLQKALPVQNLGEVSLEDFEKHQHLIPDEILVKRARHVVTEDKRVLDAIKALENSQLDEFGRLMIDSHHSLRDDYEVTGIELDTLVGEALQQEGVLGSRMTGAGFGGCTISIVKESAIKEFVQKVTENYKKKIGYEPTMYIAGVGDGAKEIK